MYRLDPEGVEMTRNLIIARIVHSPADMGSAKDGLEKEGISKMGMLRWEENQRRIEKFWEELEAEIYGLGLDYSRLKIYQDGLPCAGEIGMKVVDETAKAGSRNYIIVQNLISRGATLMPTESPVLLRQEYDCIKAFVEAKSPEEREKAEARYNQVKDRLLELRDAFIAENINSSLIEGETGILFIGAHHNVLPRIAKDVQVKSLD